MSGLIAHFVSSYLRLNEREVRIYREVSADYPSAAKSPPQGRKSPPRRGYRPSSDSIPQNPHPSAENPHRAADIAPVPTPQGERREIVQLTNSWIDEGILKGRLEGRIEAMRDSLPFFCCVSLAGEPRT